MFSMIVSSEYASHIEEHHAFFLKFNFSPGNIGFYLAKFMVVPSFELPTNIFLHIPPIFRITLEISFFFKYLTVNA